MNLIMYLYDRYYRMDIKGLRIRKKNIDFPIIKFNLYVIGISDL